MIIRLLFEEGDGVLNLEEAYKLLLEESSGKRKTVRQILSSEPIKREEDFKEDEKRRWRNLRAIEEAIAATYFYR